MRGGGGGVTKMGKTQIFSVTALDERHFLLDVTLTKYSEEPLREKSNLRYERSGHLKELIMRENILMYTSRFANSLNLVP